MDRKTIPVVLACMAVLLVANVVINRVFPPIKVPVPVPAAQVVGGTNQAVGGTNQITTAAGNPSAPAVFVSGAAASYVVHPEIPEQLLVITNRETNASYTFTSRGGGVKTIDLLQYPATVSQIRSKKKPLTDVTTLNVVTEPPILAFLGEESLQGDGVFKLTPIADGVLAEKTLSNGLTISKEFHLGTNYLISVNVRLKNGSAQPLAVPAQLLAAGTSLPLGPQDNSLGQSVMWYNGAKANSVAQTYFDTNTSRLWGMMRRTPATEYHAGSNDVSWISVQNQFFTLATMPESNNPASSLSVHMVNLPPPDEEEINGSTRTVRLPTGLDALLAYPGLTLAPGAETHLRFNIFAGPKKYQTLTGLADQFNNKIDLVMGFGGVFGPISKGLLITMNWLHNILRLPYGWTIILITVTLKLIFWPLTRASTRSAKRMQELQPQMKAMQEKYKDDPAKLQSKTWEFYKKNKVNPLGSCLPALLQIPVFFGLFGMLRSAIELRGATFLWMGDLSQPDTIALLPLFNFPINLMPLIMAGTQFWQASMMPASPGMDPAQQKMMRYMPLLMVCFLYNYSSGLALYWTVSNLLTILQTRLTKTTAPAAAAVVPAYAGPPQKKK